MKGNTLTNSVNGYHLEVAEVLVGNELNTYIVSIRSSSERYASARVMPNEVTNKSAIVAILNETYTQLPAHHSDAVFGKLADMLLQLKMQRNTAR